METEVKVEVKAVVTWRIAHGRVEIDGVEINLVGFDREALARQMPLLLLADVERVH